MNTSQVLQAIIGIAVVAFFTSSCSRADASSKPAFTIAIEVPAEVNDLIKIDKCEIRSSIFYSCVVTLRIDKGQIVPNFFTATFYDKSGVRLGVSRFPDQNVGPHESVRANIFSHNPIEEVASVYIFV